MKKLMISESKPNCLECSPRIITCGDNLRTDSDYCPHCQYAYWYEDPHPDSPHNTGLSEERARKLLPLISFCADLNL